MSLPLTGVRVVDFTALLAGPSCTMLLADFGAEVIKIEPPSGDNSRTWGTCGLGESRDLSAMFLAANRNKASVTLDLKSAPGRAAARKLIGTADVVVESFRSGVADRLGIGAEEATALNPRIIYCSLSGYGQSGPLREMAGYDFLLQAAVGQLSVTGAPGGPSVRSSVSAIDLLAGSNAALAILLALRERDASGRGQCIDVSLYDTAVYLMSSLLAEYSASGNVPTRPGRFYPLIAPAAVFATSDGELVVMIASDQRFASFCRCAGLDRLAADPRFADGGSRLRHKADLYAELDPVFRLRTVQEWMQVCIAAGVSASPVNSIDTLLDDDHARARAMVHRTGVHEVATAAVPFKLGLTPGTIRSSAPSLGADNSAYLSSSEEIAAS